MLGWGTDRAGLSPVRTQRTGACQAIAQQLLILKSLSQVVGAGLRICTVKTMLMTKRCASLKLALALSWVDLSVGRESSMISRRFQTNTLICVGSTLSLFSLRIGTTPGTDSARIAAQIVSVRFLGCRSYHTPRRGCSRTYYSGHDLVCPFHRNGGRSRLLCDKFCRNWPGFSYSCFVSQIREYGRPIPHYQDLSRNIVG